MVSGRRLTKDKCDEIIATRKSGHTMQGTADQCGVCYGTVLRVLHEGEQMMIHKRLRNLWRLMRHRCGKVSGRGWQNYFGRGIKVCDEWLVFENFAQWATQNSYKPGLELDRIDNNGNYSPSNCRFVSRTQNVNNKRTNVLITAFGETKTLAQWSRDPRCAVDDKILSQRVRRWDVSGEVIVAFPRYARINKHKKTAT